jgi:hypothetical protein
MSVPHIEPLTKWVTDELDSRIKNPTNLIKRMPFVMLTSAAVVTKQKQTQEQLRESFVNKNYNGEYYGCVLANTTDVSRLYQIGESIIGYDLKGKPIKVIGETNRKVSVPLITSLEIDTDGNNNTLKTATLQIKVFTLKQLEMFELFFLRPSMRVLLEYGSNSDLVSDNTLIKSNMFPKNNYDDFIQQFTEWFSPLPNGWKKSKKNYLEKLKETKGNYDYWAGQITQFSFSIDVDGTYNVSLEVSAGNELVTQIPTQEAKPEGKKKAKIEKNNYLSYIAKIEEDINTKFDTFKNKTKWEKEFFNWDAVNLETKDNAISKDAYISFRLALEIINSLNTDVHIRYGTYDGGKDIIPITSTKYIMSSWKDFILPGVLPKIEVNKLTGKIVVQTKPIKKNGKDVYEIVPNDLTISSTINGYSFNVSDEKDAIKDYQIPTDGTNITLPYVGNLLNAFIKYDTFVKIHKNSFTVADAITSLLEMFNLHMYGLCYLELASSDGIFSDRSKGLTIIDRKLLRIKPNTNVYRFKVGVIDSIVRNFSFSLEMSTLMQGQALYSSQLAIASAGKEIDDLKDKNLKYPMEAFSNADLSYAKNADGYYSINSIEVELQHILAKERENRNKEPNPTVSTGITTDDTNKEEKNIVEEGKKNEDIMNDKFIRFKMSKNEKSSINLIYEDPQLLQYHLHKQSEPNAVMISPIEITLSIDGLAGISCGQYFNIDGVPEIYNQNGVFQIMNTKQGINEEGWLTTIVANWLPKYEM